MREETKMKHLFLNSLAALTTLVVSAPMSFAQSTLTAKVPFAFSIDARHVLPAGDYVVVKYGGHWQLRNWEAKNTAFVTGNPEQSRATDPPQLVFECRASGCALRRIQPGQGEVGFSLPPERRNRASSVELAEVISIRLTRSQGN
jgi:hypothetical protein